MGFLKVDKNDPWNQDSIYSLSLEHDPAFLSSESRWVSGCSVTSPRELEDQTLGHNAVVTRTWRQGEGPLGDGLKTPQ